MPQTPTDPTKAQVWVTGTAPTQQLEFYIPRGAKGEPGGITLGTDLGTTNLNDIQVDGMYRQPSTANATALNNYPVVSRCSLMVQTVSTEGGGYKIQILIQLGSTVRGEYRRALSNGVWSAWYFSTSQRVDQTAGRAIYVWDDLNSREQLIYGDTGWRDVKGLTINGWTSTVLQLRRVGHIVTLSGAITATAATSDHYLPVQPGFTPSSSIYHGVASGIQVPPTFRPLGTNATNHYVTSGGTSGTYNIQANYPTTDAWPTTLPGTASGTIPNL